jgi:hypothetical protein
MFMHKKITRGEFLSGSMAAATLAALPSAGGKAAEQPTKGMFKSSAILPPRHRQVHLDFHTSEFIEGIGADFDSKQFQNALKVGKINHINVFAKCHMSWSYYPTKIGKMHPHLKFDLLGEQLKACKEIGVRAPIYFAVGWSAQDSQHHPEWCGRDEKGDIRAEHPWSDDPDAVKEFYTWKFLCQASSGPYHKFVMSQIEELCTMYETDGFWMDIYHMANAGCYCEPCKARMAKEGVDIKNKQAVSVSTVRAFKDHMRQVRELVTKLRPNATVYFNPSSHVGDLTSFRERMFDYNTQQELEDLPTTWGGYDKLPLEAKFHLDEGSHAVAMSGKFHKSWGEFGGFKSPAAIRYEAAAMIAYGVSCNFGDQLHPSGVMDPSTYRNIGYAYSYVEKIEDYGPGGIPYSRLGLWLSLDDKADRGASNMLLEMHYDYVIANLKNLSKLETIVIPSNPCLSAEEATILNDWAKNGGKLIVIGDGAKDSSGKKFILDVGADYQSEASYDVDYTILKSELGKDMVVTPFLNYSPAMKTKITTGTALGMIREPYFSRTNARYSGHCNTPYRTTNVEHASVIRNGNTLFFSHNLDKMYLANGMKLHRDIFRNAIDLMSGEQAMQIYGLPSAGRMSLIHQAEKKRYVAHLLYSPPLSRGDAQVIEDFPMIDKVRVKLNVPETVRSVFIVPGGEQLDIERNGKSITVNVPTFSMHTAVVFNV